MPFPDIILDMSDSLVEVIVGAHGYQRFLKPCLPQRWRACLILSFDGVSENSEVELSLPNLHRQLGEVLHGMGVTWNQLYARLQVFVVNVKLKFKSKFNR